MRLYGDLVELGEKLDRAAAERVVREALTPAQEGELDLRGQIDFAYSLSGVARFRVNAYREQNGLDAVFRIIPETRAQSQRARAAAVARQARQLPPGHGAVHRPVGLRQVGDAGGDGRLINTSAATTSSPSRIRSSSSTRRSAAW
jgi:twitching motility protein PilT